MKFAVDAFGGDNSPGAIIEGCAMALGCYDDFSLILTGDKEIIKRELSKYDLDNSRIEIIHAPEIISMEDKPSLAIKHKKNSSMVKALELVRDKEAECFVSAGSTGAMLTGATLLVGRMKGVKRPALAPVLPALKGCVLLLDVGANTDCKPLYLQQFALMGKAYMQGVMNIENPRIGLINNGTEAEKGNELTKEAYKLLKQTPVNFLGNCEARDILSGDFDVLVCDGFVGNIVLKFMEGFAGTLFGILKEELTKGLRVKIGAAISKPAFRSIKKKLDYTEYGGAPLLGIDGGIIKAHGSSDAKAICSAINQARRYASAGVNDTIRNAIACVQTPED
ncbi:MAG: Phosphate acyltransferase [Firmicutes bacterium ADurb.Bin182]|nr:MAG: Phosphate acyltransferase [Firmicutes bacterium ADurb.Bin182]